MSTFLDNLDNLSQTAQLAVFLGVFFLLIGGAFSFVAIWNKMVDATQRHHH